MLTQIFTIEVFEISASPTVLPATYSLIFIEAGEHTFAVRLINEIRTKFKDDF